MITFAMVVVYLTITLGYGLISKKRAGKDKTVRNFFVSNGNMGLFVVSAMLFGDLIAASTTTGTSGHAVFTSTHSEITQMLESRPTSSLWRTRACGNL